MTALESLQEQLTAIAAGQCKVAELRDEGQMVCLGLGLDGRHLKSTIKIREYQAGEELTALSCGFAVDYDMFINKLREDVREFIQAVQSIEPRDI